LSHVGGKNFKIFNSGCAESAALGLILGSRHFVVSSHGLLSIVGHGWLKTVAETTRIFLKQRASCFTVPISVTVPVSIPVVVAITVSFTMLENSLE
jgi:hypothetical protein